MLHYYDPEKTKFYRQFEIQKKNKKTRRICAPSSALLSLQRNLLSDYEIMFRNLAIMNNLEGIFHGFLKNRNIVTCARAHKGFQNTITMDISNCFDSITREMLETKIIAKLLPAEVFHKNNSLAQGFATSPILANIYLIAPIADVRKMVAKLVGIDFSLTCYADDIHISTNCIDEGKLGLIQQMVIYIFKQYKLIVNPTKTRVAYTKFGNRRILGIQVGDYTLTPSRKLKKKIRAARHQNNGPSLGGLVTASKMYLPKLLREQEKQ